jgi:cytochrome c oxidase subunit 2
VEKEGVVLSSAPPRLKTALWLLLTAVVLAGVGLLVAWSVANPLRLEDPVTSTSDKVLNLYNVVLGFALLVFLLVEGAIIFTVLRFRRRDDRMPVQVHGNNKLELAWTVAPALILASLFGLTVRTLINFDPPPGSLDIDVVGHQWVWEFRYPEQGITVFGTPGQIPEMVVPTGETVQLKITSTDVAHSFYVPRFLRKLDAIPGHTNQMRFVVDEPGVFGGQCAEFCGLEHSQMLFTVRAVEPAEFEAWVREKAPAPQ